MAIGISCIVVLTNCMYNVEWHLTHNRFIVVAVQHSSCAVYKVPNLPIMRNELIGECVILPIVSIHLIGKMTEPWDAIASP